MTKRNVSVWIKRCILSKCWEEVLQHVVFLVLAFNSRKSVVQYLIINHQSLIIYDMQFVFIFMSPFQCSRSASPHKQKIRQQRLIQGLLLKVSMCNLASLLYYMLLLSFSSQLTDCPPKVQQYHLSLQRSLTYDLPYPGRKRWEMIWDKRNG